MHGAIENRQCCQIMTEYAAGQRGRNGDRYEYCSILRLSVRQPPFLYGRCKSTRQLDRPKRAYPCLRRLPHGTDGRDGGRGFGRRRQGHRRQRIGIARALFEDPEVLVLDEATSALDNDTEAAIMESINSLHGHKTLIIIAHRLQTIEKCDIVYRVEHGEIERER